MVTAGTPYAGGVFRVKLSLSKDFPRSPPKGFFMTRIFHPNVAANGEICVNTLKKDWKAELGIKHLLLVRPVQNIAAIDFFANIAGSNKCCIHVYFFEDQNILQDAVQ